MVALIAAQLPRKNNCTMVPAGRQDCCSAAPAASRLENLASVTSGVSTASSRARGIIQKLSTSNTKNSPLVPCALYAAKDRVIFGGSPLASNAPANKSAGSCRNMWEVLRSEERRVGKEGGGRLRNG